MRPNAVSGFKIKGGAPPCNLVKINSPPLFYYSLNEKGLCKNPGGGNGLPPPPLKPPWYASNKSEFTQDWNMFLILTSLIVQKCFEFTKCNRIKELSFCHKLKFSNLYIFAT